MLLFLFQIPKIPGWDFSEKHFRYAKITDIIMKLKCFIERKNGMENKKVFSKTFGMRAYEAFVSYLYENGKKYREEENEVSIIVYYED